MRMCAREGCYKEVVIKQKQYCGEDCLRIVKNERDNARRLAKKLAGTPDDPMLGRRFDCSLSLEWLTRPLRAV